MICHLQKKDESARFAKTRIIIYIYTYIPIKVTEQVVLFPAVLLSRIMSERMGHLAILGY